jgi:putative NIF3 family GTP cyclohydrolase 1 type 2
MNFFLPRAYDEIDFDWAGFFDADFTTRFNGLMLRGSEQVPHVFCACFPSPDVVDAFISQARSGDLLFLHHPIDMECGTPQGVQGRGFLPIAPEKLQQMKEKGLSVYACHAPMDTNREIGTNEAIVEALNAEVLEAFYPYGIGFAARVCKIAPVGVDELITRVQEIFEVPYLDVDGFRGGNLIEKIAVVPGGGDNVEAMEIAEGFGAQALITGEIHTRHSGDWGEQNDAQVTQYAQQTKMALIGASHAASEFLVMKTQMVPYFQNTFDISASALKQSPWWR